MRKAGPTAAGPSLPRYDFPLKIIVDAPHTDIGHSQSRCLVRSSCHASWTPSGTGCSRPSCGPRPQGAPAPRTGGTSAAAATPLSRPNGYRRRLERLGAPILAWAAVYPAGSISDRLALGNQPRPMSSRLLWKHLSNSDTNPVKGEIPAPVNGSGYLLACLRLSE